MKSSLLKRRESIFGQGSPLFYSDPLHIVRGKGVTLYDAKGKQYIDMYNNVPCVGHCHPSVVEAIQSQVANLNVHNRYLHSSILEYGERLIDKHSANFDCVVFGCTGTEANEVALQMARHATQGKGFICTDAGYHGNSSEVRRLSRPSIEDKIYRSIPFPELYRNSEGDPLAYYLNLLAEVIRSFQEDEIPLAGMLVCPICANEGLPNIPNGFMSRATQMIREAGGLVIADEVQSGLCRTGMWWGYEKEGFLPDIVTMGKPLGAGVPLSAVVSSRPIVELFREKTRYFNTFASSPLQAAAGNSVLNILEDEDLGNRSRSVGEWLLRRLSESQNNHPNVGDVRGKGLFIAIEWVKDRESKEPDRNGALQVVETLKEEGYLIGAAGKYGNVLKLRPPLVFNEENASGFLATMERILHN
ncbi:MAG: aspartate aminotransferase family protein [Gammaproteobacteria bacterium]|nr:aspartate aminotransferase family protein [Gammaproteobacteria bacterium]